MGGRCWLGWAAGVCLGICLAWPGQARAAQQELVRNATFVAASGVQGLPASWSLAKPAVVEACATVRAVEGGLLVEAAEEAYGVGIVYQDLEGIQPGAAYAVEAECKTEQLAGPYRALLVRWNWLRAGKLLESSGAGMLVRGPVATEGKHRFHDVLVAPEGATGARLSLEVRWPRGGRVVWERASVRPGSPPPPRKVKIGTVYLKPSRSTPERNRQLFCEQIDAAGKLGLDIVCLPEAITMIGTGQNAAQCAEPFPGPSTTRLGEAAKKNRVWVVAGLYERDGRRVYNSAVLLDREGRLAGKYRKVHLPREEWRQGVTPGLEYPVFQTDFGTIAIQICYDWFFPEVDTLFALQGAEIIFAPTWGSTFADKEGRVEGETVFRVRARDNGVYLVPSVYDGSSMIIDPRGRILVSNQGRDGLFWHEVDLSQRECLWWVGHWRAIGPRDRMPETYQGLLGEPAKPTY